MTMHQLDTVFVPGVEPPWTLADRLRRAREYAGLQQTELADAIGIARRSLITYEAGRTEPKRPILLAWALRTGVDSRWLERGFVPSAPLFPDEIEENEARLAALTRGAAEGVDTPGYYASVATRARRGEIIVAGRAGCYAA